MILVTGGLGFLGSHIALDLMSKGHEVVLVDNLSHSSMETLERLEYITKIYIPFIRLDIRNTPALQKVFEQYNIEYVINAAGFKSLHEAKLRPLDYYNNNLGIMMSLLRAMQRASVRRLVNISSIMVYGDEGLDWKEQDTFNKTQTHPYIRTQQMNEYILKDVYEIDDYWQILNLRLSNIIGANTTHQLGEWTPPLPNSVLPSLLQVASGHRDVFELYHQASENTDGTSIRNYLHVLDAVDAIYQLMLWSNTQGNFYESFNITHDKPASLQELITAVEKVALVKIIVEKSDVVSSEFAQMSASNEKIKQYIGWVPKRDLDDMVKDQWSYYQSVLKKSKQKI